MSPDPVSPAMLNGLEALAGLPRSTIVDIADRATLHQYVLGDTILTIGEPSTDLYLIVRGVVRINLIAPGGRELTYQLLPAGEMFGELSAIDGQDRSTSVTAEAETALVSVSAADVSALMGAHPEFCIAIVHRLARLSRRLISRLYEYHAYNVRGRVIAEILRIAESGSIAVTDRDMASRVGTTRENVSRIHKELRETGVIERAAGTLGIRDRAALEALLEACEFS